MYGPTETTVIALCSQIKRTDDTIVIGAPIGNVLAYVLDKYMQPVPVGVTGELHIGGTAVARGYINNPELTRSKFIPNPFGEGRLYKTGDVVRWLDNRVIEYIGRTDTQVKLRGVRIELGEIESVLMSWDGVKSAVVMIREDQPGSRILVAYVSPNWVDLDQLKQHTSSVLPSYMIPQAIIAMNEIPLTSNGKVDKRALPAPALNNSAAIQPPASELEATLVVLWSDALGIDSKEISTTKRFFELGGDSIIAILLVSKAKELGIQLTVKQIFELQTIKAIATVCGKGAEHISVEYSSLGKVLLTPIQKWFFSLFGPQALNYFNQTFVLSLSRPVKLDLLERALWALVDHHDILRAKFSTTGATISEFTKPSLQLSLLQSVTCAEEIYAEGTKLQAMLDIVTGPLIRAALYEWNDQQQLQIVIHHLVVDGVSWRILLADLQDIYTQLEAGNAIKLNPKTVSFKQWAQLQNQLANDETWVRQEVARWEMLEHKAQTAVWQFPRDFEALQQSNTMDSEGLVVVELGEDLTTLLLGEAQRPYRTQINDLLLAAFGLALSRFCGKKTFVLELEGHGREPIFDVDISRTIGWFTTQFPVVLTIDSKGKVL